MPKNNIETKITYKAQIKSNLCLTKNIVSKAKVGTCSNFLQSLICQSSGGGDSGQKTKSASDANAATIAKYL